jgi:hypothetical protein
MTAEVPVTVAARFDGAAGAANRIEALADGPLAVFTVTETHG